MGEYLIYNRKIPDERKEHGFTGIYIPVEFLEFDNGSLSLVDVFILSEIKYYCTKGKYKKCVVKNEHFMDIIGISERTVKRSLAHLSVINAITISGSGDKRVIKFNADMFKREYSDIEYEDTFDNKDNLSETMTNCQETMTNCQNSSLKENNKKDNNIKKPVEPASSKKYRHDFVYRDKQSLNHALDDADKYIADFEKSKKKSPKDKFKDECLDIIDDEYSEKNYSYTVKDLLVEYFEFVSAVPENKDNLCKRVKTAKMWKNKLVRLDELVKDGYDPIDIIQQSLDNKAYVFYPLQSAQSKNKSTGHKEGNQENIIVSDPEYMRKRLEEDESEEWY